MFEMSEPGAAADEANVEPLVRAIQAGDCSEENFRRLFEHFCDRVTRYFTRRGVAPEDAEELAQDVFLRVYKSIGEFRFDATFESWLFLIAGNVLKNLWRRRATLKRAATEVPLDEQPGDEDGASPPSVPSDDATPLEQTLAEERTQLLGAALETLPEKMRECVQLRLSEGLKHKEIATVLKVSPATVKTHLTTAYQRLRPLLERHFEVFEL